MHPWNGNDSAAGVPPAERALSFISKSLHDVQKSANRDLKLMKQRAKSFRDLANSLDKGWEKGVATLKLPLPKSSGNFFRKIRETGPPLQAPSFSPISVHSSSGQDSNFLRNLKPTLQSFRRSQSDPSFSNRLTDEASCARSAGGPFSNFQGSVDSNSSLDVISTYGEDGQQNGESSDWSQPKPFPNIRVNGGDWVPSTESARRSESFRGKIDDWEPFRRAKESVKESLKELEVTTFTSKNPAEFFENLKNIEFFDNVKKNLKLRTMKSSGFGAKTESENEVAPLDVTELLENLVRQSGPLLDQLGVKKDVSEKVCEVLRSHKRKDHTLVISSKDGEISTTTRADGKSIDDLDLRIASIVQSTGYRYKGGLFQEQSAAESNDGRRNIAIVTTASLPWMTGTAVNPLFRAAYLAKNGKQNVTLLVPWLSQDDQELVYPHRMTFSSPVEQETYVRNWLEARIGFRPDFKITFYPGRFSTEERSIFAVGDISQFIPDKDADVAVLEEPEHLTWYYHGKRWTDKFKHVVGVVHTNYLEYIKREKNGPLRAFVVEHVNNWMTRVYCHKVIRLSGATQMFPKSVVCNVHGVNPKFLRIGEKIASDGEEGKLTFSKGAYYLGKMVWSKGYRELVDLLNQHKGELGSMDVDVYGTGEDSADVEATSRKLGLRVNFHQGRDHADDSFHRYKVFINPSKSDVVCTTTAEALAMGKNVVCAYHPSNDFFQSFPNCYVYKTPEEFVQKVKEAMTSEPVPLTAEQRYLLSWEAATDRFLDCAELDNLPRKSGSSETAISSSGAEVGKKKKAMSLSMSIGNFSDMLDRGLAFTHFFLSGIEPARRMFGALPGTIHPDIQLCKDLNLLPPSVQRPIYTW
ncbi:hypothetical protein R1sor_027572 [Riccia sorocarpa]|uniref:Digalactosyldiacylglycerol synthase n=1 Tax=Riccia sorocarpa TaxID=122646 RepID=A0ABD3GGP8_9MARC